MEVQTLAGLDDVLIQLNTALLRIMETKALDGTMLLITDVMSEDSILLLCGLDEASEVLPYERLSNGAFSLPGILSRKKQLLPEILRAVEETRRVN